MERKGWGTSIIILFASRKGKKQQGKYIAIQRENISLSESKGEIIRYSSFL
jgi:hypothetical protein